MVINLVVAPKRHEWEKLGEKIRLYRIEEDTQTKPHKEQK